MQGNRAKKDISYGKNINDGRQCCSSAQPAGIFGAASERSETKKHRIWCDLLLEEVLRQASIPLLHDRDSETLVTRIREFLRLRETDTDVLSTDGIVWVGRRTELLQNMNTS